MHAGRPRSGAIASNGFQQRPLQCDVRRGLSARALDAVMASVERDVMRVTQSCARPSVLRRTSNGSSSLVSAFRLFANVRLRLL